MEYRETITLKDGRACVIRQGTADDAEGALRNFVLNHAQTDFLTTYPDEIGFTMEQEAQYLQNKADSPDEVELVAEVAGSIVGQAGIARVGRADKVKHRATFGISIDRDFWHLGIGRTLTKACIQLAKQGVPAAGAGGRGGQRAGPGPLRKRGLRGVRPEPQGLPVPVHGLAGPGAHAPGAVKGGNHGLSGHR